MGDTVLATEDSIKYWLKRNNLTTPAQQTNYPDLTTGDGSTVSSTLYFNGLKNTSVGLYTIKGGGHAAPSIQQQYSKFYENNYLQGSKQNHDIEMADEVWRFFKKLY